MTADFVHLRLHTEYSLVDGLVRLKPLVKKVAEQQMPAVAVTDICNFFALVKFYKAAQGAGIKPICGTDVWLWQGGEDAPALITLLAQTTQGYKHITEIISRAYQMGQHLGRPYVRREWIRELNEGVIALSGGREGDVGQALLSAHPEQAQEVLQGWLDLFGDRFYLELQRTGRAGEEDYLHAAVELALANGCPVVATNDVRFISSDDFSAHETRVCIHDGVTLDDPRREHRYSEQQYLRTPSEMVELFSDIPEALANTVEIAKRCSMELELGKYYLPDYPIPEGLTMDTFFIKLSEEGLEERLHFLFDSNSADFPKIRQEYDDRLKFELDIIIQMGFPGYFLIVMDFIQWAKDNGVPVGPGRGSGAGSLVAYALNITDLDPLAYDLLFERFLNPERVSMPDFDIDFCMDGRDRVISYVADNYGRDAVSQIITFGTMAAKAVVRDVARVQGKSYGLADKLSKLIPFEVGMTLAKAIEQEAALKEFLELDEEAQEIWEMALQLEGVTRNVGKHAGGVVIAPTKLIDFSPLFCDEEGGGLVTQFDKDDVEQAGLVKFDFLGLRTLTIIDWAKEIIDRQLAKEGKEPLEVAAIPLEDKPTFDLLQRAETTAVFQLESRGMKDLIKRLLPSCFEDIVALVALFRPGPLQSGMVDDFINRKHGRAELAYPHPQYQHADLEPVLKPTYGIILYQEQVMQIAQVLAKYSLGGADLLRRAMGKKKPEVMAEQRVLFMEGALKNNIGEELAGNIFDLMEKFAGYGFNKSHSAAYALVSYHTAWLKCHYPAPFMAAVLSADMQNTDKVVILVEECRAMKLPLTPPDVNVGEFMFTVNDDGEIVYGLGAIKGLGEGPIDAIICARQEAGPFKHLFDFCERVDLRKVNKRALEALIRSGALDKLGDHRALLAAAVSDAVQAAEQTAKNEIQGIADMFGDVTPDSECHDDVYQDFANTRQWSSKERLKGEKDTLGLYLTGHPIDEYERELRQFVRNRIVELRPDKGNQTIAGLVVACRTMKNKRGATMAFLTLDDRSARIEISLFSEAYEAARDKIQNDVVLVVDGVVSHDDYSGSLKIRGNQVSTLAEARMRSANYVEITLESPQVTPKAIEVLDQVLAPEAGQGCPVRLRYLHPQAQGQVLLGAQFTLVPDDDSITHIQRQFGDSRVVVHYR